MKLRFRVNLDSRELWKPLEEGLHHLTDLQGQLSGGGDDQSPHLHRRADTLMIQIVQKWNCQ